MEAGSQHGVDRLRRLELHARWPPAHATRSEGGGRSELSATRIENHPGSVLARAGGTHQFLDGNESQEGSDGRTDEGERSAAWAENGTSKKRGWRQFLSWRLGWRAGGDDFRGGGAEGAAESTMRGKETIRREGCGFSARRGLREDGKRRAGEATKCWMKGAKRRWAERGTNGPAPSAMSAHLRLLSAAALPLPSSASLRRVHLLPPAPPLPSTRLLARSRGLGLSPRAGAAVRCRCVAAAGAGDGGGELEGGEVVIAADAGIWEQARDVAVFAGPALGLWICGPLMSLIDTMVIGQTSSLLLAALGPGTVFCDYLCYIFMFLSIATSNMVATSLANKDEELAHHQVSMLLFIALAFGIGMFLFTKIFGVQVLTAFTGSKNYEIISAANTYTQIRGFAWPAVLVGLVAQSASLGMKDSWGPLKALAAASVINGVGDIFLCSVCGYGIAGAAWATMVSQIVAAYMMMQNLNNRGFRAFSFTIPSTKELLQIFEIAAPVFVTMISKVAFFALLTYSATSMGAITLAAHQVMVNILCMCTVWGEPLSQTAQSFMPEMIYGAKRNLMKARMLLKSLVMIGAIAGVTVGTVGTIVPWLFPSLFTNDQMVVQQMHRVLIPYFTALLVTPSVHCLEGTLLAGRDLRYLSLSMGVCFCIGTFLLLLVRDKFASLPICWWILVFFQWGRFGSGLQRLVSPTGMLYNENFNQAEYAKVKATEGCIIG